MVYNVNVIKYVGEINQFNKTRVMIGWWMQVDKASYFITQYL